MASATAVSKALGDPITKSGYTPVYFSFAPGSYMDYTTWWCNAAISGDQVNPGSFYGKSSYSSTVNNTFYIDVLWQKKVVSKLTKLLDLIMKVVRSK